MSSAQLGVWVCLAVIALLLFARPGFGDEAPDWALWAHFVGILAVTAAFMVALIASFAG